MKNFIAIRVLNKILNGTAKALPPLMPLVVGSSVAMFCAVQAQAANLTESAVMAYASSMKTAANQKNMNGVANLVSDDALISLSRLGKTTSLNKSAYLQLLEESWHETSNYSYDITITNVVISGNNAKADVKTIEKWDKDGKQMSVTTDARATLTANDNDAVLLRAVAQVTID